jgi:serine/threonine protein kinase
MPAAAIANVNDFVQAIVRTGLLPEDRLYAALKSVPVAARGRPETVADYLVRTGHLSAFQAVKILSGTDRGLVLGPYCILAPVGRGGMGAVYLARDARDQRLVALKVLPPQRYRQEERQLARFRREMEICEKVSHPHITRTFDAGVINNVYFIAMEYVPGMTLKRKVTEAGPLPVSRSARFFGQVADALEHAHLQGLIHRDLKPGNIMVTPNGHAKVLDLGLALIEGEQLPEDRSIVGGRGYVVGTMDFIAPEQVTDPTGVDGRADIYSLGCSLYYVLTGQVPFPGGTSQQKIRRHLNETPALISDLNPTIPVGFAKLVEQLMSKRPEQRPPRADDVRRWMLPWAGGEPDLPMDVAVDNSNPREIFDLETDQKGEGSFWESVPVAVFVNSLKSPRYVDDDVGEEGKGRLVLILASAGVAALLISALVGLALWLILRK